MRRSSPFSPAAATALLATLSLGALLAGCSREGSGSPAANPTPSSRQPVWVIGLDGADWTHLDRLLAAGAMPELARLVREGRRGVLTSEEPILSPLVWTTMFTGVSPLEHRVLDFARLRPGDGTPEPMPASERRAPAVWNMASAAGRKVVVLGMWATWPAEPVDGLVVSDRFFGFLDPSAAPAGSVYPAAREAWARERLNQAERSTDLPQLARYVPGLDARELARAANVRNPYEDPVAALRRVLVETATYDALFREAIAELHPALAILYLQGTDSIGHAFARYAPPHLPGVTDADAGRFGGVPDLYFRHVDSLLGEYRRMAEREGALLLLVSDHGFHWGASRPAGISSFAPGSAARWHREDGIQLLWGRGVAPGEMPRGGVRQVCATLLDLLGLPPGSGLAGPSLAPPRGAPRQAVDYRRGFAPVADPALATPSASDAPATDAGAAEALARLRALGYLGDLPAGSSSRGASAGGPTGAEGQPDPTRTAGSFNNEALLLRRAGRVAEAETAFAAALARDPKSASAMWNLSELLQARAAGDPAAARRSDQLLVQALQAGLPQGVEALVGRALGVAAAGQRERAQALLGDGIAASPSDPRLWLTRGRLRLQGERCADARTDFTRAAALAPQLAEAHAAVGVACLCVGDEAGATAALRRSLALDPAQPELRRQLIALGG